MSLHAPLVIDVAGTALTADDRRRIAHPLVGGVILFARNWSSRAQLTALCAELKALRPDVLLCVDHEGGRVQRFRSDGFTHLPPMRAFGQLWQQADAPGRAGHAALRAQDAASAAGYVLGAELRACGVDLTFAPVLDLDWPDEDTPGASRSRVVGDRAFHADARVVTLLAKGVMHGLLRAGMAHCGKHFPGHGFVRADSHVDIPVDRRGLRAILADDAAPYDWLGSVLTAVMPAHVIYPRVDARPAGFSRRWLHDILRQRLGFAGAIFSDDLSMAGARRIQGHAATHAEAVLAALAAGCDLALLCNQSLGDGAVLDETLHALQAAAASGAWRPDPAAEARRRALLPVGAALPWDELMRAADYRRALAALAPLH